jgi:hypothetical protein
MTSPKDKLLELAEQCEAATGPDRDLDLAIGLAALGWEWVENYFDSNPILDCGSANHVGWKSGNPPPDCIPSPTGSIDAAKTLVPERAFFTLYERGRYEQNPRRAHGMECPPEAQIYVLRVMDGDHHIGSSYRAATPALALCAAALRSRSQTTEPGEG